MNLSDWVGRQETAHETIDAARIAALAATFDRDPPGPHVPPGWHWAFFNPAAKARDLGRDGHPKRGGFLPPVDLPRRMWAGGRLEFRAPLPVGAAATRVSTIAKVEAKTGRSGRLAFVTVAHEIAVHGQVCVAEEHDIVYREDPVPGAPAPVPPQAPSDAAWEREFRADPTLLFRYSALTFNGHRIHYDRDYATGVEGYAGLIVHGPLLATLLMDLAVARTGRQLRRFAFRAQGPVVDTAPFVLCGKPTENPASLWVRDATEIFTRAGASLWVRRTDGAQAMAAEAFW
jgi:3-methylfumaryl-CoA hydratase